MRTPIRRLPGPALLALLAVLALLAGACGGDGGGGGDGDSRDAAPSTAPPAGEEPGDPVTGGTLTVGLEAETNSYLPGESEWGNAGFTVAYAVYDPLVVRTADGSVQPYLAQSVRPNRTFDRWTVRLRDGVMFHDGTALDAAVMKTIFDDYLTAPTANTAGVLEGVSMEVVDDLTIEYRLDEANAAFLDLLVAAPGMPFSPAAAARYGADAGAHPVGTGPFVFESWARDDELRVTRNPDYWRRDEHGNRLPYLDEVVFKPIPDEGTRVATLESGGIDTAQTLRQSTVRGLRDLAGGDDGFQTFEWVGNNAGGNIINTMQPPFDDVRVRQALALALDQDQLIEVLGGTGISPRQTQYFSPDSPWYSDAVAEAWPNNDPERAQELLDEYVNDPDRSDGASPGTPVSFTYNCPPDPSLVELSQAYQAFWQNVGFEVDLQALEQSELVSQALGFDSDPPMMGTFEVQCFRLGSEADPYTEFSNAFDDWHTNVLNFTNFTDPSIDENLEILRTTDDTEARQAAVEAIGLVIAEQVPNTFTGSTAAAVGARAAVRHATGWTTPDGIEGTGVANAVLRVVEVWLDEG